MTTKRFIVEPSGADLIISNDDAVWKEVNVDKADCFGACTQHKGKMYIVLQDRYCEATSWHEAHHAARMINAQHGIDTDVDDHEADCYMMEYIARLIKTLYFKKSEIKITAFHK